MAVVYAIKRKEADKFYIGSTIHPKRRKSQHFSDLRKGRHTNIHLQRAFNKYGENQFEWIVLEESEPNLIRNLEKAWIDKLDSCKIGYNISEDTLAPMTGRKNPNARSFGKGEEHENAILDEQLVKNIFELAEKGLNQIEIALEVGCHHTNISYILSGKGWQHLGLKFNKITRYNNTSGCVGVYYASKQRKWIAEIIRSGKHYHLGCFKNKQDAINARKKAEGG